MKKPAIAYGYHKLQFLERDAIENILATQRYRAGVFDSGSGHLHPLNYTLGLAAAAQKAGAQIFEKTTVTDLQHQRDPATVTTPNGACRAKFVVICCNAYSATHCAFAARAHHAGRHVHRRD